MGEIEGRDEGIGAAAGRGDGRGDRSASREAPGGRLVDRPAVRVLLLFALLFAIGLATRAPAWQFPSIYALHGVLAAPFCAALAQWHFARRGNVSQLVAATVLLAVLLGAMSPAMGLSFAAVALLTALCWALSARLSDGPRRLVAAVAFGALDYPCALAVGLVLGLYVPGLDAFPLVAVLVALSAALSFFGALVAAAVADSRKGRGK